MADNPTRFSVLIRRINEAQSGEELSKALQLTDPEGRKTAQALINQKTASGGALKSDEQLSALLGVDKLAALNDALAGAAGTPAAVENERAQFKALLFQNPNYFGNLEASAFK